MFNSVSVYLVECRVPYEDDHISYRYIVLSSIVSAKQVLEATKSIDGMGEIKEIIRWEQETDTIASAKVMLIHTGAEDGIEVSIIVDGRIGCKTV